MRLRDIRLDGSLCELTPRGTPSFPIGAYDNDIAEFALRYVPWHWHAEAELVCAPAGGVRLESRGHTDVLGAGEGAFINANCLHAMRPVGGGPCETINLVFSPELIAGAPYSVFEEKYVRPLLRSGIGVVPLRRGIDWQEAALAQIRETYRICEEAAPGYEFGTRERLSSVWALLCARYGEKRGAEDAESGRLKTLLTYIRENYREPITLADIARSADVCERTCCRCFRELAGMTPFEYLSEYRVKAAADLLENSEDSVTEICYAVGFHDASYFTRVFREATGRTPTAFRRERRAGEPPR